MSGLERLDGVMLQRKCLQQPYTHTHTHTVLASDCHLKREGKRKRAHRAGREVKLSRAGLYVVTNMEMDMSKDEVTYSLLYFALKLQPPQRLLHHWVDTQSH